MDDSFENRLSFTDIKNLSQKSLKEIRVSRISKICRENLRRSTGDLEIYKFILNDYIELVSIDDLETELFGIIFPEIVDFFKEELGKPQNDLTSLICLQSILSNLTNNMRSKVFPECPNVLKFSNFCLATLEIARESFGFLKEVSNCNSDSYVEEFFKSTCNYYFINLTVLKDAAYFFEEVVENELKFNNCLSALLDISCLMDNNVQVFAKTWQTMFSILTNNSEELIKRIENVEILSSIDHLVSELTENIIVLVRKFINGEGPFQVVEVMTKLLIKLSDTYKTNLRGFQKYLSTLISLCSLQYDENIDQEIRDKIYAGIVVGFMTSFEKVYKNPLLIQELSKLKLNDPSDTCGQMNMFIHTLDLMFHDPNEAVLLSFCPNNPDNNIFCMILKLVRQNDFLLYENQLLYRELVIRLSSLMLACGKKKDSFQTMEKTLVENLMSGKFVVSMLCEDVFVLISRVSQPTTVLRFFHFFEDFHAKSGSILSMNIPNVFSNILLKLFYRMLPAKHQKLLNINEKTKIVIGLDIVKSVEDKSEALEKFVRKMDGFMENECADVEEFYRMIEMMKLASTTKIPPSNEAVSGIRKLFKSIEEANDLLPFNSIIITAFEVMQNTEDSTRVIQYLMFLNDFARKNRSRLHFGVKVKLLELLGHFIKKCPPNSPNGRNVIAVEIKRLAVQNEPVFNMLIYQMFLDNPGNFVLEQVKEICPEIGEVLRCQSDLFRDRREYLNFLVKLGSIKTAKHSCVEREVEEMVTDEIVPQKRKSATDDHDDFFKDDSIFNAPETEQILSQLANPPPVKRQKLSRPEVDEMLDQFYSHSIKLQSQKEDLTPQQIVTIMEVVGILNKTANFQ